MLWQDSKVSSSTLILVIDRLLIRCMHVDRVRGQLSIVRIQMTSFWLLSFLVLNRLVECHLGQRVSRVSHMVAKRRRVLGDAASDRVDLRTWSDGTVFGLVQPLHLDVWIGDRLTVGALYAVSARAILVIAFIDMNCKLWIVLCLLLHKLKVVVSESPLRRRRSLDTISIGKARITTNDWCSLLIR